MRKAVFGAAAGLFSILALAMILNVAEQADPLIRVGEALLAGMAAGFCWRFDA